MATKRKRTHTADTPQALEYRARTAEREWLITHPELGDSLRETCRQEDPERKRERDRQREETRVRVRPPRGWKRVADNRFTLGVREIVTGGHPVPGETERLILRGRKGHFETKRPIYGRIVILKASDDSDLQTGCRVVIRRPKKPGGTTTIRVYRPKRDADGVPIKVGGREVELPPVRTKQSYGVMLGDAPPPVTLGGEVLAGVHAVVVADLGRVAELDYTNADNHPEWAQLLGTAMTWALQRRAGGAPRNGEEMQAGSSGHSIREWLARNCPVPMGLTERMIDAALNDATLSRGGGRSRRHGQAKGKRSLANVLGEIVRQVESMHRKPEYGRPTSMPRA